MKKFLSVLLSIIMVLGVLPFGSYFALPDIITPVDQTVDSAVNTVIDTVKNTTDTVIDTVKDTAQTVTEKSKTTTLVGSATAANATSGTTGSCTWTLNGTELTISGSGKMADYTSSSPAPWGKGITKVTIGDNVTSIGIYAFYKCTGLTSITIPNSVKSIDDLAFYWCTGLTSVTIGNGVTSIGDWTFDGCTGLTSITIPNSVTSIGSNAFSGCTGLKTAGPIGGGYNIEFGWSDKIPDDAFYHCTGLKSIEIPNSVTSIGDYAFYECTGLTSIEIPNSVTSIGYMAFAYCTGLTSIVIPNSVTSIGNDAFYECTGLKTAGPIGGGYNIEFGWTDKIPDYAFYYCTRLKSIEIPNSVTSIGWYAFSGCTGLNDVYYNDTKENWGKVSIGSGNTDLTDARIHFIKETGTTGECTWTLDGTELTVSGSGEMADYTSSSSAPWGIGITKVTIGDYVTSIGNYAFYYCTGLTSIEIPNSVTSIGDYAFDGCTGLTEINYYAKTVADLTSSSDVFYNAGTAKEGIKVTFGDSVERIPAYLFYVRSSSYRPKITSVTIGNNVTSIGSYAFEGCTNLTLYGSSFCAYSWAKTNNFPAFITIPCGENAKMQMELPSNIFSIIGNGKTDDYISFAKAPYTEIKDDITKLNIGADIEYLGNFSFYGCSKLKEVHFENPDTALGYYVFSEGANIKIYSLGNGNVEKFAKANGYEFIKPQNPTVSDDVIIDSYTDTSVTLKSIYGYEYKCGNGNWQSSNVFTNLDIRNNTYTFYQRIAETSEYAPSVTSSGIKFTKPTETATPDKPVVEYYTDYSVKLKAVEGYEYKCQNGNWQENPEFTGLNAGTSYTFYQRIAETQLYLPSVSSSLTFKTLSKSSAPQIESIIGQTITLKENSDYEFNLNGGSWQKSNVFQNVPTDILLEFRMRLSATTEHSQSPESDAVKAWIVGTPKVEEYSENHLVIKMVDGYQYSIDGFTWQDSNVFDKTYKIDFMIYQRLKNPTGISVGFIDDGSAIVYVNKKTVNAPPKPIELSKTSNSVTLNMVKGCEYSIDGIVWQDSPVFTGLEPGKTYSFYQRYKETDTTYASKPSDALEITTISYTKGDIDGSEGITSDDAIYLLHHTFEPEDYPVNQPVDFDGDGFVTSDDAIYLLHYTFEPEDYPLYPEK